MVILLPCLFLPGACGNGASKPDIILIVVDTLRADHLGCYGYARDTSPNIDRFAGEALLFENCLANGSNTRVSVAGLLSGFLPHETGVLKWRVLAEELETLPEILQAHGYRTAAVISNYVLRKKQGYEQGFLLYDDTMDDRELVRSGPERVAEHTTDRAIEVLEQPRDRPLFLWIHYQDPHGPYAPPTGLADTFRDPDRPPRDLEFTGSISGRGGIPFYQQLGRHHDFHYYRARYDAEIRYLDAHFRRLIAALKRLGMYDDSVIVLTADHGEGMGEHDYFFAHGEYLYQDQLHVPLILRYGNELIGRTTNSVQHVDVVPTLLKIVGIDARAPYRGTDLRGVGDRSREIFAEMSSPLVAAGRKQSIVSNGLKLIRTSLGERFELYDLNEDPREERDVFSDPRYTSQAEAMRDSMARIRGEDRLHLRADRAPPDLTDEELENLKSLGYLE